MSNWVTGTKLTQQVFHASKHRRSIRLAGYDYRMAGAYFVTICAQDRECLFGEIADGKVVLSPYGQIVQEEWIKTPGIRKEIGLDLFVVMPNHLHGIVIIYNDTALSVGAHGGAPFYGGAPVDGGLPKAPICFPQSPMCPQKVMSSRITGTGAGTGKRAHRRAPLRNDRELHRTPKSLGALISGFKSIVTKRINAMCGTSGRSVWQRNYYEQIIRDEPMLNNIREYITNNPAQWAFDHENPNNCP